MFKIKKSSTVVDMTGEPTFVGDWIREKELGTGGFGIVHLWVNKTTGDSLAIKKCRQNLEHCLTEKQRERWSMEVEIMKNIKNANIVAYRVIPEDLKKVLMDYNFTKLPMLPMEYCHLGNLRTVLVQPENCCGLQELDILFILNDVANALKYLHKMNVVHRDLKPENIVLQHFNGRSTKILYKLIDLGYAKELDNEAGSFFGTPQYLAPEIFIDRKYTKTVDYWSFGIVTFEIICGMRPFLHTFTPWQSIGYLEKKQSDVISIQLTYNGEIKLFKELFKENHINMCLSHLIEKWLQKVLEYCPKKRSCCENEDYALTCIQDICLKKIIIVYSVYTYEFLSYEITDSTLFSTLQGWIGRDTKIPVVDQYIVSTTYSDGTFAIDYYDKQSSNAMLFVFKKDAVFASKMSTTLPSLIKVLFENIKTEFKFGTLKQLHAQTVYLILKEMKQISTLKQGIYFQYEDLTNIFDNCNIQYTQLKDLFRVLLNEVDVYNYQDTSLFNKVYEDTNYIHVSSSLKQFKHCLQQLVEIINIFNKISIRRSSLCGKYKQVTNVYKTVLGIFGNCDFITLVKQACDGMNEVSLDNSINLTAGPIILKIVSTTIKMREKVLKNPLLIAYLRCVSCCWKETNKLRLCLAGLHKKSLEIKTKLKELHVEKIKLHCDLYKMKAMKTPKVTFNGIDVLEENISIRYQFQELMDAKFRRVPDVNAIYAVPFKKIQD